MPDVYLSAMPSEPVAKGEYRVGVGFPGLTGHIGAFWGWIHATRKHGFVPMHANAVEGNFNALWATALSLFEEGKLTHFAMIHSDVVPENYWADVIIDEMERFGVTYASAPIAIKDMYGRTSCGIIDPKQSWHPLRCFTIRELARMPETFDATSVGYPGYGLVHNNGLWVADLRDPRWHTTNAAGELVAWFDFPRRIIRDPKTNHWKAGGESEDYYFARKAHELGIPSVITRKVKVNHLDGHTRYANYGVWGQWEHDEKNRALWEADPHILQLRPLKEAC